MFGLVVLVDRPSLLQFCAPSFSLSGKIPMFGLVLLDCLFVRTDLILGLMQFSSPSVRLASSFGLQCAIVVVGIAPSNEDTPDKELNLRAEERGEDTAVRTLTALA
jgi:hypothetical protein